MRTKTLLLSAAAMAAGLVSAVAQSNVYSANVVGYVNIALTNGGFTLVGNQLDVDGNGTNNTVLTSIGTNLPPNTHVLAWNTNLQSFSQITLSASGNWSAGVAGALVQTALQPGGGVFVQIPATVPAPGTNIVLVGTVLQKTNLMTLAPGFQIVSYPFPVAGALTANFNYVPNATVGASADVALTWNSSGPLAQTFTQHKFGAGGTWSAGDPQLPVGGAVFLNPYKQNTWTNSFIVQ